MIHFFDPSICVLIVSASWHSFTSACGYESRARKGTKVAQHTRVPPTAAVTGRAIVIEIDDCRVSCVPM